jgi:hypothetical protein
VLLEDRHHAVRLETLADEIPEQASEFCLVGEPVAAAEPPGERGFEQRGIIYGVEYRIECGSRGCGSDAGLLNLPSDTQFPVAAHRRFGMRNRLGYPRIVDRPFRAEPRDGRVHGVRLVALAGEALPDLSFGQLTTAKHSETVQIGAGSRL